MKDFSEFSEYFPAKYGAIVESVRQSVENNIVDKTSFNMDPKDLTLLYLTIGKISIETSMLVLESYHKWLTESEQDSE